MTVGLQVVRCCQAIRIVLDIKEGAEGPGGVQPTVRRIPHMRRGHRMVRIT